MTGTLAPTIPTLGDPNSTEDPDVRSALVTLRDGINAVLTSANKLDGAQIGAQTIPNSALTNASIALAKLANGADKQLIIVNGSGVPVYRDLSGDATVSNTGGLTIANNAVDSNKADLDAHQSSLGATVSLNTGFSSLITQTNPAAGTWLVIGNVVVQGAGGSTWELNREIVTTRLTIGGTGTDTCIGTVGPLTTDFATVPYLGIHTLDGTSNVVLQAKVSNLGSAVGSVAGQATRLSMLRYT